MLLCLLVTPMLDDFRAARLRCEFQFNSFGLVWYGPTASGLVCPLWCRGKHAMSAVVLLRGVELRSKR